LALTLLYSLASATNVFIYPDAPEDLVVEAKQVGEYERRSFRKALAAIKENDDPDKILELYAKHLTACSNVGSKLTERLERSIGEKAPPLDGDDSKAQQILTTIGFDQVSARLFTLSEEEIKSTLQVACLKHELQFQCADGFLNDPEKIRNNIEEMKKTDGNVKIMLEQECPRTSTVTNIPRVYSCVGAATDEIHAGCSSAMDVFNKTRSRVNSQIRAIYRQGIDSLGEDSELTQLGTTMNEIRRLEAFRCRIFNGLEKCALGVIEDMCGGEAVPIVQTIIRVGQLSRERGPMLHEHFVETGLSEHQSCSHYAR